MIIEAKPYHAINLGRVGENEVRIIKFDVTDILTDYPSATFSLLNQRPSDLDAYPVDPSYYEVSGNYLLWTVQSGDLAYAGTGECQIVASSSGAVVKTDIYTTFVGRSLDDSATPPEPWESWVNDVVEAKEDAETAAESAEEAKDAVLNMTVSAEGLAAGSDPTATYEDGHMTFGIPAGETPEFSIGTVTTGDAGTNAAVTKTGTDLAPVLNFTIPKGAKGDAGNGDMLAPAFVEATPNDPGTYVTYNGTFYYLPNGHEANVTWANTTKTSTTVGGQLSEQKSALTQTNSFIGMTAITMTAGYISFGGSTVDYSNPVSSETYKCAAVDVTPGQTVIINAYGGNGPRAYGFCKNDGTKINSPIADANADINTNEVVIVPAGAQKLIINDRASPHRVSYIGEPIVTRVTKNETDISNINTRTGVLEAKKYNYETISDNVIKVNQAWGNVTIAETDSTVSFTTNEALLNYGVQTAWMPCTGLLKINVTSNEKCTLYVVTRDSSSNKEYHTETINTSLEIEYDLDNFAVYENAVDYQIMFVINASSAVAQGHTTTITYVDPIYCSGYTSAEHYAPVLGDWLKNIDQAVSEITPSEGSEIRNFVCAPNGTRYVRQIKNDKTEQLIPVVPSKVLIVGNSLLLGFGYFGMAANDINHDYKHYLESATSATITTKTGVYWEEKTSTVDQNTWIQNQLSPLMANDIDLVIVQLGDNVNTSEKKAVFAQGSINLLKYIRENSPNARVVWAGYWYNQGLKEQMINACINTGCQFIDFSDLNITGNQNSIGTICTMYADVETVYTVTSYTDDAVNHELTMVMTLSGTEYTKTIKYTSYTADGNELTVIGKEVVITRAGVATHPGNKGMRLIANRMLYELYITDNKEYFNSSYDA